MSTFSAQLHRLFNSRPQRGKEPEQLNRPPAAPPMLSPQQTDVILRNITEGIVVCDPDGNILHMNPAALKIYSCKAEDVIRHPVRDLPAALEVRNLAGEVVPVEEWPISRALRGETFYDLEIHLRKKDSGKEWFGSYGGCPIFDDEGRLIFAVVSMRDVTHLKKAEAELAAAKAAAERSNAAKDELLAVLSHELRTPLTPVLTAAQILQKRKDLPEDVLSFLEMMSRNIGLEVRLIDDLLDLTRIVRGKVDLHREHVAICTIVEKVIELCEPEMASHHLEVRVDLHDRPLWVHGDPSRLQQLLWNLVKNAIKFTPEHGTVTISGYRLGEEIAIEVKDTGVGIEAEAIGRIFGAFEQADRSVTKRFGGLGLGLAITKKLVELHDGTIRAESAGQGKGSTFVITLPFSAPSADAQAQMLHPNVINGSRHARILLVEDHADTAQMLSYALRASGYEVETAGDVGGALKVAQGRAFDLLVSDLGLPDRSGLDLMTELQSEGKLLKGIALSGFGQEEDLKRSKAAGFVEHLTKPVNIDALLAVVDRLASA